MDVYVLGDFDDSAVAVLDVCIRNLEPDVSGEWNDVGQLDRALEFLRRVSSVSLGASGAEAMFYWCESDEDERLGYILSRSCDAVLADYLLGNLRGSRMSESVWASPQVAFLAQTLDRLLSTSEGVERWRKAVHTEMDFASLWDDDYTKALTLLAPGVAWRWILARDGYNPAIPLVPRESIDEKIDMLNDIIDEAGLDREAVYSMIEGASSSALSEILSVARTLEENSSV